MLKIPENFSVRHAAAQRLVSFIGGEAIVLLLLVLIIEHVYPGFFKMYVYLPFLIWLFVIIVILAIVFKHDSSSTLTSGRWYDVLWLVTIAPLAYLGVRVSKYFGYEIKHFGIIFIITVTAILIYSCWGETEQPIAKK
jgi:hypothetical protein